MRHLRKFNESKNDIMILGDIYLAYLKDYGFGVDITDARFSGYKIVISKKNGHKEVENMFGLIPHWEESDYTEFRWEDVKYDLITFIEELLKKWTLNKQPSFVTQKDPNNNFTGLYFTIDKNRSIKQGFELETILRDDFEVNNIISINIEVY